MEKKLQELLSRLGEVETALGNPDVHSDKKRYKELSQDHSYLSELKEAYEQFQKSQKELGDNQVLIKEEKDPEFAAVIQEDIERLEKDVAVLQSKLESLLVPPDPNDHANVIMELRAGTGGDEAAIFVGNCVRMYRLFSDKMGWKYETLALTVSEAGGYKEYVISLSGKNVHRYLQYEAGTHRVQRVPVTETQGRVHTSAITVAVLMEPGEDEKIEIDPSDLKIDTYRAQGAGGQHVNTTDSAVRITHIPTGVVVYCQEERSQHKNKEKALRVLAAKLAEEKRRQEAEQRASLRSSQVGTGDRSERIRTYNYAQNRVTDHRINLTLYKLDQIMEGDLKEVTESLIRYFYQEKLHA
ncbi:peptide chain release factor 1 [Candidatus Neptunochlamydia vexilliferae]|uniref:Peptide chain release factor 1 n=1 Tax=Candidatus Neptunichlamydia vexilliferae TaxID=1651774 RepID=A0ABS0AZF1_9BACT|nr:peptide chain release factor 1 [Candidatus Neptunochlamydia vexilliferae]MBF5059502.1 Peptide chain release factor 1 [Candidatus Neptunochlamydia vexilliferae]